MRSILLRRSVACKLAVCVVFLSACAHDDRAPAPAEQESGPLDFGVRDNGVEASTFDTAETSTVPVDTGASTDGSSDSTWEADVSDASSDVEAGPATCTDLKKNGEETDIDCGGPTCDPCTDGKTCLIPANCKSKVCLSGKCAPPSCTDTVKNGAETDIDCGGTCPKKCAVGKTCGAGTDCVSTVCSDMQCKCPSGMTIMPTAVAGGGDYCIDSTEVTYGDYVKFWTANPALDTAQPSYCISWNKSWTPSGAWPPDPSKEYAFPVRYVDWCDAFAYCKWAGKTLCGKIGGGANAVADAADHLKSQWYNACSAQGSNIYPYSGAYSSSKCNGADWAKALDGGVAGPHSTATTSGLTAPSCQGGAPGLYGMSGNLAEWEDSCSGSTGATDTCLARGGSYTSSSTELRCDAAANTPTRNTANGELGFRCCY